MSTIDFSKNGFLYFTRKQRLGKGRMHVLAFILLSERSNLHYLVDFEKNLLIYLLLECNDKVELKIDTNI